MKKLLIATAALMAGTAALAQTAQTAPAPIAPPAPSTPPAPMAHPMADKTMTRAEVVAMVRDHFGRMDTDKNGSITTEQVGERGGHGGHHARARRFRHG